MVSAESEAVLRKASEIAFAGLDDAFEISQFSRPRQVFATVYAAQGIIDNGGFQYLFANDWPDNPDYTWFSDAYREIGAIEVAEWFDEAASLFPFPEPHRHQEKRRRYLEMHCTESDSPMGSLSDAAMGASNEVFSLLAQYVQNHPNEFTPLTERDIETRLGIALPPRHRAALVDMSDPIHTQAHLLTAMGNRSIFKINADMRAENWKNWPDYLVAFATNECGDYFAYDTRTIPYRVYYIGPTETVPEGVAACTREGFIFETFDDWYTNKITQHNESDGQSSTHTWPETEEEA